MIGEPCDAHIVIGTPKELVSMRILGGFQMDKIKFAAFDDADVIVTSDMVQRHLINPLAHAQIVLSSTTICSNYGIENPITARLQPNDEILNNLSFNFVRCDDEYKKFDVARQVTGRDIPAKIEPRRAGDPATLVASSARARQELGWTPRRDRLEDIIASAWQWHINHPEGYGQD